MVVSIAFKPSGSNKTINIPYSLIADRGGNEWVILVPKIDKTSFTFDIPSKFHDEVKKALWDLPKEGGPFFPAKIQKNSRYKTRATLIHPASGRSTLIEADPKPKKDGKHVRFMHLEFNPEKLGADGIEFLKEQLEMLFLGNYLWKAIAANCKITRIDLALDVLNIPIDQLVITSSKSGKSHCYYSASGALETAYLEVKSGKSGTTTVYNKNQQLADKKRKAKFDGIPHTRIEAHVKTSRSMVKLKDLPNPFLKLNVANPAFVGKPPEQHHNWQHLLDSVRYRGRIAALDLIPDETLRQAYADALVSAQTLFWNPEKLWAKWSNVLVASGLLPSD